MFYESFFWWLAFVICVMPMDSLCLKNLVDGVFNLVFHYFEEFGREMSCLVGDVWFVHDFHHCL